MMSNLLLTLNTDKDRKQRHPKCEGYYDPWSGDYDCGYDTKIDCDECKYGMGRKDPEAKCNQLGIMIR